MWEVTYTITPDRGYIDGGEQVLHEFGIRLQAATSIDVLRDDSVVIVYDVEGDAAVLREILSASGEKIVDYAITTRGERLIAQMRIRPDECFRRLLEIHQSYGVSIDFPITYLCHDPVTVELVQIGPKDQLRSHIEATRELATVEIQQLNRYEPDGRQLYRALTERQREVLRTAVEEGYYRTPREATHADIADALSCSASVVGQHLRRIETTLATGVVPDSSVESPLQRANGD